MWQLRGACRIDSPRPLHDSMSPAIKNPAWRCWRRVSSANGRRSIDTQLATPFLQRPAINPRGGAILLRVCIHGREQGGRRLPPPYRTPSRARAPPHLWPSPACGAQCGARGAGRTTPLAAAARAPRCPPIRAPLPPSGAPRLWVGACQEARAASVPPGRARRPVCCCGSCGRGRCDDQEAAGSAQE